MPLNINSSFRLPSECESVIMKHVSTADLISLSQVSRHCRDLSAKELYRTFHIVFPNDEDPSNDSLVDSLAAGLDTFVTSDYDYARYLKEIILEALAGGTKSEDAYRSYTFDTTCGKFLNTMLLLTLRKAKALETFKWDIRVELSREVFKELHRIGALQHFHVRMQRGRSIYEAPTNSSPTSLSYDPSISNLSLPLSQLQPSSNVTKSKTNGVKGRTPVSVEIRTFSGLKNLKSLSVLDMDDMDYLSEIRSCIENSSTTLTSLKLSFSEDLASKARKQPVVFTPDDEEDSEPEDGLGQLIQLPDPQAASYVPSKSMQTKEEKKSQEAALGKIFGIELSNSRGATNSTTRKEGEQEREPEEKKEISPATNMFLLLQDQAAKYVTEHASEVHGGLEKKLLDLLAETSDTYIQIMRLKPGGKSNDINAEISDANDSNEVVVNGEKSESSNLVDPIDEHTTTESDNPRGQPGLFDESKSIILTSKSREIVDPDDIDIEQPDAIELFEDLETVEGVATEPESIFEIEPRGHEADLQTLESVDETNTQESFQSSGVDSTGKDEETSKKVETNNKGKSKENGPPIFGAGEEMSEYIRRTRGLPLEELALYLIPLRIPVISKAIDIRVLGSITLLGVGHQNSFWNMVARENIIAPLPLHKIYTDNVTLLFLAFIGQLQKVDELCLLERTPNRIRVDPTVLRTTVTIEHIRKLALKKHVSTLKVLSIHQEPTNIQESVDAWSLNPKTAILLCRKAKKLEELAAAIDNSVIHIINQNISGLESLRALHVIEFRAEDSSIHAQKEFKRFIMDSISHNPDCELEYLALKNSITRIFRRVKRPLPKHRRTGILDGKHKYDLQLSYNAAFPNGSGSSSTGSAVGSGMTFFMDIDPITGAPLHNSKIKAEAPAIESSDDSADEEDFGPSDEGSYGLKLKFLDGFQWHDVYGVRIFENDLIWKRL